MAKKKMRRFAIAPTLRPNAEINVTPLVDVVLVLLIIFMVVTPLLEKNLSVRVPDTQRVATPTELPDQVVVYLDPQGAMKINTDGVEPADLVARLTDALARREDKTVFVVADDKAPYPALVAILDGARQAGAVTLGMTTEPPPPAPAQTEE
ncbi:MAG: biopolymer transporter ExbD [Polyangiaceae bacterium]